MPIKIYIVTIFPEMFHEFFKCGVIGRTLSNGQFDIKLVNPRDYVTKNYKSVDDYPFGGGPGMVMRADILKDALIQGIFTPNNITDNFKDSFHVIYTGPRGEIWSNTKAKEISQEYFVNENSKHLIFICGRYEGIDERFLQNYVDQQISIGDYVLSGGELAVQIILDSALRFIPNALGNAESSKNDSFEDILLEHPHYTRPPDFEGAQIPEVLLSGHHKKIEEYRQSEKIRITKECRPDLLAQYRKNKGK